MGYWKFVGKCLHHGKMVITWLIVPQKRPNLKVKIYLETRIKAKNFVKIVQTSDTTAGICLYLGCLSPKSHQTKMLKAKVRRVQMLRICENTANESPLRGKFMTKIRNFDSFGGCIHTFLPRLSGQRLAPAGVKTYFWTTEQKQIPTWLQFAGNKTKLLVYAMFTICNIIRKS